MRFSEMIEGLQILAKYEKKGLESHLNGAEHDIVWAADAEIEEPVLVDEGGELILTDTRVSAEDAKRLDELGWHIDGAAESWAHYC